MLSTAKPTNCSVGIRAPVDIDAGQMYVERSTLVLIRMKKLLIDNRIAGTM